MRPPFLSTDFQASRIEDEPILGTVLRLSDGRIQTLTWWERMLVTLRLTDAKAPVVPAHNEGGANPHRGEHAAHDPPQSTSVSSPFCSLSAQPPMSPGTQLLVQKSLSLLLPSSQVSTPS